MRYFCASSVSFKVPPVAVGASFCAPISGARIRRPHGLRERPFNFGDPGRCPRGSRVNTPPITHLDDSWLLVAAWVDTSEACMVDGFGGDVRASLLRLEHGYSGPPRFGSFASFCGFFVDVVHEDGSTTTWLSSFARNASRHFHAEVFRISNPSPMVSAVVTAKIPASAKLSSVAISDVSLHALRFSDGRGKENAQAALATLSLYAWQLDPRQHRSRLAFRSGLRLCPEDSRVIATVLFVAALVYLGLRLLRHGGTALLILQRASHLLTVLRAVLQRAQDLLVTKSRGD
jgi:hypothetical protein